MSSAQLDQRSNAEILEGLGITPPVRAKVVRTGERTPISFLVRQLVYRRDGWTCQRCSARPYAVNPERRSGALHLDHIKPWSAGGSDRSDNIQTLCGPCNMDKSNYVTGTERPALPIVRICAVCISPLLREPLVAKPDDAVTVYCGSRSHTSWTIAGASIL